MESPPGEPTWRAHMESPCGSFSPIFQKVRDDNLSMSAHIKNAPPSAYSPPAWRLQSSCSARRSARSRLCVCGRGTILAICATHGGTSHGTGRQWTPRAVSLHPRARQGLAGAACPVGGAGAEREGAPQEACESSGFEVTRGRYKMTHRPPPQPTHGRGAPPAQRRKRGRYLQSRGRAPPPPAQAGYLQSRSGVTVAGRNDRRA